MKKLMLLAGLPGVGKSTIARILALENEGAIILDMDDFKRTDVDPALVKSQIDPPDVRWAYYEKALEHALSLPGTVIMDDVFHLDFLRRRIEHMCMMYGIRVEWIEVRCSFAVVERRLRTKSREGHILSTDEALAMHRLFQGIFEEFLKEKKNHTVIHNENDW